MTGERAQDARAVQVELPADQSAPAVARERTRSTLRGWRLPAVLDPLLLVVSELVGNAVRHGRPPVAMLLRRSGDGVRVEVHDEQSAEAPAPSVAQLPEADAESGRGLFLVDAVSAETGVEDIPGDGKVVWATVDPDGGDEPREG